MYANGGAEDVQGRAPHLAGSLGGADTVSSPARPPAWAAAPPAPSPRRLRCRRQRRRIDEHACSCALSCRGTPA